MRSIFFIMNYEIDQLKLSEQIIAVAKKVAVTSGLYILLTFIILFFVYFIGILFLFDFPQDISKLENTAFVEEILASKSIELLLLNGIVGIIAHYLLSGVYGMIHQSATQPYVGLGTAYQSVFSTSGLKALNVIIAVQVSTTALSYFLEQAGFGLVALGVSVLVQLLTYFAVVAIYVHGLGVGKSISLSIAIINQKPVFLFLFIMITYFLSLIGILFFGIGIILTLPLNYIVAYCLYQHISNQLTD